MSIFDSITEAVSSDAGKTKRLRELGARLREARRKAAEYDVDIVKRFVPETDRDSSLEGLPMPDLVTARQKLSENPHVVEEFEIFDEMDALSPRTDPFKVDLPLPADDGQEEMVDYRERFSDRRPPELGGTQRNILIPKYKKQGYTRALEGVRDVGVTAMQYAPVAGLMSGGLAGQIGKATTQFVRAAAEKDDSELDINEKGITEAERLRRMRWNIKRAEEGTPDQQVGATMENAGGFAMILQPRSFFLPAKATSSAAAKLAKQGKVPTGIGTFSGGRTVSGDLAGRPRALMEEVGEELPSFLTEAHPLLGMDEALLPSREYDLTKPQTDSILDQTTKFVKDPETLGALAEFSGVPMEAVGIGGEGKPYAERLSAELPGARERVEKFMQDKNEAARAASDERLQQIFDEAQEALGRAGQAIAGTPPTTPAPGAPPAAAPGATPPTAPVPPTTPPAAGAPPVAPAPVAPPPAPTPAGPKPPAPAPAPTTPTLPGLVPGPGGKIRSTPAPIAPTPPAAPAPPPADSDIPLEDGISPEQEQQLRDLGYASEDIDEMPFDAVDTIIENQIPPFPTASAPTPEPAPDPAPPAAPPTPAPEAAAPPPPVKRPGLDQEIADAEKELEEVLGGKAPEAPPATIPGRPEAPPAAPAPDAPTATIPGRTPEAPAPSPESGGRFVFDEHGEKYPYRVEEIEEQDLLPSYEYETGKWREGYDRAFQQRPYTHSSAKKVADAPDPDRLRPEGTTSGGSPVVWKAPSGKYQVLSGNHRAIGMLASGKWKGKKVPVRVFEGDYEAAKKYAAASQRSDAAPEPKIARARAVTKSLGLTIDDLPKGMVGEKITRDVARDIVNKNRPFGERAFPEGVPESDEAVAERLNDIVVGLLPESVQDVMAGVGLGAERAIAGAAGGLLDLRRRAAAGTVRPEYDVLSNFERAAKLFTRFRGKKSAKEVVGALNDYVRANLFDDVNEVGQVDPTDAGFILGLLSIEEQKDPEGSMTEALARLHDAALADPPGQAAMFEDNDPLKVVRTLFGKRVADLVRKFRADGTAQIPGKKGSKKNEGEAQKPDEQVKIPGREEEKPPAANPDPAPPPATPDVPPADEKAEGFDEKRFAKLADAFFKQIRSGEGTPKRLDELKKWVNGVVEGDPAEFMGDVRDAVESAIVRWMAEAGDNLATATVAELIAGAQTFESRMPTIMRDSETYKNQQFSTPLPIAVAAAHAADVQPEDTVLEPTAGTGNLVVPFITNEMRLRGNAPHVIANEMSARRIEAITRLEALADGYLEVMEEDFLRLPTQQVDVLIANYPWGTDRQHRLPKTPGVPVQDLAEAFTIRGMRHVKPGGRVVLVNPTTTNDPSGNAFRAWIEKNHTLRANITTPNGAYKTRGTSVGAVIVVFDEGKNHENAEKYVQAAPATWEEFAKAIEKVPKRQVKKGVKIPGRDEQKPPAPPQNPADKGVPWHTFPTNFRRFRFTLAAAGTTFEGTVPQAEERGGKKWLHIQRSTGQVSKIDWSTIGKIEDLGEYIPDDATADIPGRPPAAPPGPPPEHKPPKKKKDPTAALGNLSPEQQAAAAALEQELKDLLTKPAGGIGAGLGGAPDLGRLIVVGTKLGALYIEAGIIKFADFVKALVAKLGDAVKRYAKTIYNATRDNPDATNTGGMDTYAAVQAADVDAILNEQEQDDDADDPGTPEPPAAPPAVPNSRPSGGSGGGSRPSSPVAPSGGGVRRPGSRGDAHPEPGPAGFPPGLADGSDGSRGDPGERVRGRAEPGAVTPPAPGIAGDRRKQYDDAVNSPIYTPSPLVPADRRNAHPTQVVMTRALAGVPRAEPLNYQPTPYLKNIYENVRDRRDGSPVMSEDQYAGVLAVLQANRNGHGILMADDVGVGKSREIAGVALEWMASHQTKRLVIVTKSDANVEDLLEEMRLVATGDVKGAFPTHLRRATDFKESSTGYKKGDQKPLPNTDGVFVIHSHQLAKYADAFNAWGMDGLIVDEAHTFKNVGGGIALAQGWKALHHHLLAKPPEQRRVAYFTATPATQLEDLEFLYGLGHWTAEGDSFYRWIQRVTGAVDPKTLDDKEKGGKGAKKPDANPDDVRLNYQQLRQQWEEAIAQAQRDIADTRERLERLEKRRREMVNVTADQIRANENLQAQARRAIIKFEEELRAAQDNLEQVNTHEAAEADDASGGGRGGRRKRNKSDFNTEVSPAMQEQIMRELYYSGHYVARDLWRGGVEFREGYIPVKEDPKVRQRVRDYIDFCKRIKRAFEIGESLTDDKNFFGIGSQIQSAMKRFLFDVRLDGAIAEAQKALANGERPVISLINVNEVNDQRGNIVGALNQVNVNDLELDDDGNIITDEENMEQAALVDALRKELKNFTMPDPIAKIEEAFGKGNVVAITGRTTDIQKRKKMADDFREGRVKVAVISGAGKTGISLHDRSGTGKRNLIVADYEWSATNFKQELGRVDRSGQRTSPIITLMHMGAAGEKKFLATISTRMRGLGAVSKGSSDSAQNAVLEEFELGGARDLGILQDIWREMPDSVKAEWFDDKAFGRYEEVGNSIIWRADSELHVPFEKFLLQLQTVPLEEGDKIWDEFMRRREIMAMVDGEQESATTLRSRGKIVETTEIEGKDLTLYTVKPEGARFNYGLLQGVITPVMYQLNQIASANATGREAKRRGIRRDFEVLAEGDKGALVTGLRIAPMIMPEVKRALGVKVTVPRTVDEVRKAIFDLGQNVPVSSPKGEAWTLKFYQPQRLKDGTQPDAMVKIDGSGMRNREQLTPKHDPDRYGVKLYGVSGGIFVIKPADLGKFLQQFPVDAPRFTSAQAPVDLTDAAAQNQVNPPGGSARDGQRGSALVGAINPISLLAVGLWRAGKAIGGAVQNLVDVAADAIASGKKTGVTWLDATIEPMRKDPHRTTPSDAVRVLEMAFAAAGRPTISRPGRMARVRRLAATMDANAGFTSQVIADTLQLTYNPKLKDYRGSEATLSVADDWHLTERAVKALGGIAEARVAHVLHPLAAKYKDAMGDLLIAQSELARAKEGRAVEGGRSIRDLRREIASLSKEIPADVRREVTMRYRLADLHLAERLIEMERIGEDALLDDHVYHLVLAFKQGGNTALGLAHGARTVKPGPANKAKGSERAIERDPFRALYQQIVEVERAYAYHKFKKGVVEQHNRNAAARVALEAGEEFDTEGLAFYSFGPNGPEVKGQPATVEEFLKALAAGEKISPKSGKRTRLAVFRDSTGPKFRREKVEDADAFAMEGRQWFLMDKRLAEGLLQAGKRVEEGFFSKAMRTVGYWARYFTWVLRPLSQVKQILGDPLVAMSGVNPWYWANVWSSSNLWRRGFSRMVELAVEHFKEFRGQRSEFLEELRLEGITDSDFYHQGEAKDIPAPGSGERGHFVPEDVLPIKFRSRWGKVKGVAGLVKASPTWLGASRETLWRSILADHYEFLGASRNRAVLHANEVMTDYVKKSLVGQKLAPLTQFTKFLFEQALRLTVRIAKDPVTGENASLRGLLSGPGPLLATLAAVVAAVNGRDDETEDYWNNSIPSRLRKEFTLVGPPKEDGTRDVVTIDSQLSIALALYGFGLEAYDGKFGKAAITAARTSAAHMNPAVRLPFELAYGIRSETGAPIVPSGENYLDDDEKRRRNALRGGSKHLTGTEQYAAEQLFGWPVQAARVANQPEVKWQDKVRTLYGAPVYNVGPRDKLYEEKLREGGDRLVSLRAALNEWNRGDATAERRFGDELEWLRKHGYTKEAVKAYLTRGDREAMEAEMFSPGARAEQKRAGIPLPWQRRGGG